jgi:hypothetical protein
VNQENYEVFVHYLNEREAIRQRREQGLPGPWTDDPILRGYKFTNILRKYDRTTRWLVKHWYNPNRGAPKTILALNCAIARYFGSIEFLSAIGFQREWNPDFLIRTAEERLRTGQKVFTGAYIITNAGSTDPKQVVVVSQFLTPLRFRLDELVAVAERNSWQDVCEFLQGMPGIGPFMGKEIALDMTLTPVLENATDKLTWSPAGPGAIRGLNRLHDRPLQKNLSQPLAQLQMQALLGKLAADHAFKDYMPEIGVKFGVTDVQFCLCELDKYLRVKNGEGRPRSTYDYRKAKPLFL